MTTHPPDSGPPPFGATRHLPTPFLLLDLARVERNVADIRKALPGVEVWYAHKCNPDPRVAATLAGLGVGFEVASAGEVRQLLAAGIPPGRMMCLHTVKAPAFVRLLHEAGVDVLAVDSREEIEKLARLAPGSRVVVRFEIPDPVSRVPLGAKFGCPPIAVPELLAQARRLGLQPYGVTTHVGSQCESLDAWAAAGRVTREVVERVAADGPPPELVSLGGGLPVAYSASVPGLSDIGHVLRDTVLGPVARFGCRVTVEPGRAVVASAGTLVTTVVGTAERAGVRWVYLDAGIYHGLFELLPAAGRLGLPVRAERTDRPVVPCRLAGPTCDSTDTLPGTFELPEPRVGDRLAFLFAGAYSTALATTFNGFDTPATVVLPGPEGEP